MSIDTGDFWLKVLDWAWIATLGMLAFITKKVSGWEGFMRENRARIELLEQESKVRQENAIQILKEVAEVRGRIEAHRIESANRMDSMRAEIREDYRHLMDRLTERFGK